MQEKVLNNPLVSHKLSILREKDTPTKEFREIIKELAILLCYEAFSDEPTTPVEIETPIAKMKTTTVDMGNYAFVPILRAGLGMVDGILQVIPNASIGHIGLQRNEETLEPIEYYFKMPKDIDKRTVLLLDPMLATGGSAVNAISQLKKRGVKKIKFLCIVSAPQGIEAIKKNHPDVQIFTTAVDEKLNDKGYIVPGLGDAGDRIFGTVNK